MSNELTIYIKKEMKKVILPSILTAAVAVIYYFHDYLGNQLQALLFLAYDNLQNNQFMQTVVFGTCATGLAYYIREFSGVLINRFRAWLWSTVTIRNTDPNYNAVIDYITDNFLSKIAGARGCLQATTAKKNMTWREKRQSWLGNLKSIPTIEIRPNDDSSRHTFEFEGTEITCYRRKGETMTVGYARQPKVMEDLTLCMWGTSNEPIIKLINAAIAAAAEKEDDGISVYVQSDSWLGGFEKAFSRQPRKSESVVLDVDHAHNLLEDARNFLKKAAWYNDMGIPYRRGYLLHGPPGCGKSSFALVLASELKLNICILNLSQEGISDNNLASTLRDAPPNAIVLLEDVDAIFVERKAGKSQSGVSFSGLLNAIDGIAAQEGRILLMTTNHIERLDPALIRPGRCDVQLELRKASKLQLERMFLRFFPDQHGLAIQFKNRLPADELSMAQLQGHFLEYSLFPELCVENIPKLLDRTKPKKVIEMSAFDYLKRVGLEKYTAYVEFLGIYTVSGFTDLSMKTFEKICPEIRLDIDSYKRFEKLLSKDENFMKSYHALPDIAFIRECFLSAYPTLHEVEHGERDPMFRQKSPLSRQSSKSSKDGDQSSVASDVSISLDLELFISNFASGEFSQKTNDIPSDILDQLSRDFVFRVSEGGKSKLSIFQLNSFFAAYPDRPVQCVIAARSLTFDKPQDYYLKKDMTVYQFLKRLDCLSDIHKVESVASSVSALYKNADENSGKLNIRQISHRISEAIATGVTSISENLISFQLVNRPQIMREFLNFSYSRSLTNFKNDSSISLAVDIRHVEEMAYDFARKLTDDYGNSPLSLYELKSYLEKATSPADALSPEKLAVLLADPPRPERPAPSPPPPRNEWIYEWLRSAGFEESDIERYGDAFVGEHIRIEDDLRNGCMFDIPTLEKLEIKKVGHQRKILHLQKQLIG